jgi:hypothetical protein
MAINFKRVTGLGGVNFKVPIVSPFVTTSLIVNLDASNSTSYPGTGTIWYDLSGNNNNFNIVASAYNSSGPKYMNFGGGYGIAKNGSNIPLSDSTGITYMVWTQILNSTANWRTLTRAYAASDDHQVIILYNSYNLGMYDGAGGAGFVGTGYNVTSIPGYSSGWYCLYWRWQNFSPYYEFSYNDTPGTIRGSITNSNGRYQSGFGAVGGYHENNTTPSNASQYWGNIGQFLCYNRRLTDVELLANYNATKERFGL